MLEAMLWGLVQGLTELLFHDVRGNLTLPKTGELQLASQLLDNLATLGLNRARRDRMQASSRPETS